MKLCQDLSLAGKRQGMETSQAQGGTRSGLLWEVERILNELSSMAHTHTQSSTLPQVLLMENVPEVIGVGNVQHFNKWLDKLESLGYTNHFQILNGKDYGIPQNRRRVFMVSILGGYAYDFPIKLKLKYRLKDFLEKKVDEKYYLSDKDIERISSWDSYEKPIENAIDVDDKSKDSQIVPTLTTHVGKDSAGMKLVKVGNYGNGFFSKNVYDSEIYTISWLGDFITLFYVFHYL